MEMRSFMNPPPVLNELVAERAAWVNATPEHREKTMRQLARDIQTKFDRDNPFAYDDTITLLRTNVYTPEDFRRQLRSVKK